MGYALWKTWTWAVRAELACLFCYRREHDEAAGLVRLQDYVLRTLEPGGEVLVVVGTRAAADTFPDGYCRPLRWNPEARELGSMARRA